MSKLNESLFPGRLVSSSARVCRDTEGYFLDALELVNNDTAGTQHTGANTYYGQDGQPIAFQKTYDEPTALTLTSVKIDEVVIPKGMIIAVQSPKRVSTLTTENGNTLSAYQVGELVFRPLRLSPWAFGAENLRAEWAILAGADGEGDDSYFATKYAEVCLDDFRRAAQDVMELCGVAVV